MRRIMTPRKRQAQNESKYTDYIYRILKEYSTYFRESSIPYNPELIHKKLHSLGYKYDATYRHRDVSSNYSLRILMHYENEDEEYLIWVGCRINNSYSLPLLWFNIKDLDYA